MTVPSRRARARSSLPAPRADNQDVDLLAGLVLLGLAGLAALHRLRAAREVRRARERAQAAEDEVDRLGRRVRALQREVELLSAIREVSLIANDDVSFERILGEVLKIVEDLVESSEVAIYLADETTGELRPRVVRRGGESRFAEPARKREPAGEASPEGEEFEDEDRSLVDEAFRERRTLRRVERGEVAIATLLFADAEIAGVLAVRGPGAGRSDEDLSALEAALEALAKHVALAIKKPTLYDKAVVDSLTRLFTKRHFVSQLARYCATSRRTGAALGLVLCDIDHFKKVNDTHGHLTGDLVLAEVAAAIRATIREYDSAYRYGGEEMAVILPEAPVEAARALAERLRAALEAKELRTAKGEPLRVTASFGVATFAPGRETPEALVGAADEALYEAKRAGRNRVRAPGDPPEPAPAPRRKPHSKRLAPAAADPAPRKRHRR
jgi:diguanylate cyclase (GGDEF)-like protein